MELNKLNAFLYIVSFFLIIYIVRELVPNREISSRENQPAPTAVQKAPPEIPQVRKADKIEVVNFHATQRCFSCKTLGELSEKTVRERFAGEVQSGKMVFREVNVDLPENEEITNLYQAGGSSLYINAIKDGKNNIVQNTKVWQFLNDDKAFADYLELQLKTLL